MVKFVLLVFFFFPLLFLGINFSLWLLSVPNDLAVYSGYVLFISLITIVAIGGYKMLKPNITKFIKWFVSLSLIIFCCSCYKIVQPGYVGLLVKQTGSDRGVQDYPIQTGRVFYNPINENVLEWPTNVQRVIWTVNKEEGKSTNEEIAFQSKEGLHFVADVNAAYQMERAKVPYFYVQFRTEDTEAFTHGFFRDAVRNAFKVSSNYSAEEINGAKQADLIKEVEDAVKVKMLGYGVDVIQIGFAAPPRPPEQVKQSIEQKIAAIQKSEQTEFEKRAAIAEGEKVKALADAYAEANERTNKSLTPQLIEWEKIKKWDGKNSQVITGGATGLMIGVK